MIELKRISKRFGAIQAVEDVSLKVEPGEVLGFLGPNGAGKSTTMKMVTGFLSPTSGTAVVCGRDVREDPLGVKGVLGYLPEGAPAYPDMTAESFLGFVASVRGFRGREAKKRIERVKGLVHLEGVMRQPIETLSKGYKRRVGLAAAIVHDPAVLILDEPTDGLDPNQKHEVRQLIREMAGEGPKKVIVLSTHILEEVETVCTRAVVIARGRVVADETPAALQARSAMHNAVTLRAEGAVSGLKEGLMKLDGVARVEMLEKGEERVWCRVYAKEGRLIVGEVREAVQSRGLRLTEMRVEAGRLDEVFRTITAGGVA